MRPSMTTLSPSMMVMLAPSIPSRVLLFLMTTVMVTSGQEILVRLGLTSRKHSQAHEAAVLV